MEQKTKNFPAFDDIIGYEAEKKEAKLLVSEFEAYLSNPSPSNYCPKGILLTGDPGLGKTMCAKAIVKACKKVEFYDFDDLAYQDDPKTALISFFKKAHTASPRILFIDEVDRLIPQDTMDGFVSDDSRGALSALLTGIDGIKTESGVLVIMTAQDKGTIDPALFRPGRIDKIINFDYPTFDERVLILKHYANFYNCADFSSIDFSDIAAKLSHFPCSALKTLIGEVSSVSREKGKVDASDLYYRINSLIVGSALKASLPEAAQRRNAVHECGHAIVIHELTGKWPDANIYNSGPQGGVTHENQEDPDDTCTSVELKTNLAEALAGRCAETLVYGKPSEGCCGDMDDAYESLRRATDGCILGYSACLKSAAGKPDNQLLRTYTKYLASSDRLATHILRKKLSFLLGVSDELFQRKSFTPDDFADCWSRYTVKRRQLPVKSASVLMPLFSGAHSRGPRAESAAKQNAENTK